MSRLTITSAAFFLAATVTSITRAEVPRECAVVQPPDKAAIEGAGSAGPYAGGMRAFTARRWSASAADLSRAWERVRARLSKGFSTGRCEPSGIRSALGETLFARPATAVPGEDRFLPPPVVVAVLAYSLCAKGDLAAAARWLADAGLAGDGNALAASAVLFAASGSHDTAIRMLPRAPVNHVVRAALAFALTRAGRAEEAKAMARPLDDSTDARTRAILDLLRPPE